MPASSQETKPANANKSLPTPDEKGVYTLKEAPVKSFFRHASSGETYRNPPEVRDGSKNKSVRD